MTTKSSPLPYIALPPGFANRPEVRRFKQALGVYSDPRGHHLLIDLYLAVGEQFPDGELGQASAADLAACAQYEGEPDKFLDALTAAGIVTRTGTGLAMDGWSEAAGYAWGRRAEWRRGKAEYREKMSAGHPQESDGQEDLSAGRPQESAGVQPLSTGVQTVKGEGCSVKGVPEGRSDATSVGRSPLPQAVIEIPLKGGGSHPVTQAQLHDLARAFPGIDVPVQLRLALAWCQANPRKRKTGAGVERFIYSWLVRAGNGSKGQSVAALAMAGLGHDA